MIKSSAKIVRMIQYKCLRCGKVWIPRIKTVPKTCPKCRSKYWDKKIERQSVVDAQKKRWKK